MAEFKNKHTELYDAAEAAIDALFFDKSVSQTETAESLRSLMGHIGVLVESLD